MDRIKVESFAHDISALEQITAFQSLNFRFVHEFSFALFRFIFFNLFFYFLFIYLLKVVRTLSHNFGYACFEWT